MALNNGFAIARVAAIIVRNAVCLDAQIDVLDRIHKLETIHDRLDEFSGGIRNLLSEHLAIALSGNPVPLRGEKIAKLQYWDSEGPNNPEVYIEEIDHFDARGKFQVHGRGGIFGKTEFDMTIWRGRDRRMLVRFWSKMTTSIGGRSR